MTSTNTSGIVVPFGLRGDSSRHRKARAQVAAAPGAFQQEAKNMIAKEGGVDDDEEGNQGDTRHRRGHSGGVRRGTAATVPVGRGVTRTRNNDSSSNDSQDDDFGGEENDVDGDDVDELGTNVLIRDPQSVAPARYNDDAFRNLCARQGKKVALQYGRVGDAPSGNGARPDTIRVRSLLFMQPGFTTGHCTYDLMHVEAGVANSLVALVVTNKRGCSMSSVMYERHGNRYVLCWHAPVMISSYVCIITIMHVCPHRHSLVHCML